MMPPAMDPERNPAAVPAAPRWALWAYHVLAVLSLALGVAGVFLPVLPTTPFILLAAWAAARGSPRLLAWMESHPLFGKMLRDWRQGGVVSRKAKWSATWVMGSSAVIILVFVRNTWAQALSIGFMAAVLLWLWQRPQTPPNDIGPS